MITQITTIGMSAKMAPIGPPTSSKGKNAAIVVKDEAVTGPNIRLAPPSAACSDGSPLCTWVKVSSPTTMASSTIIPKAMIIPKRLIMLIEPPNKCITPQAANKDAGIPIATQKATRELRNKKSKPTTSSKPVAPLLINNMMRCFNNNHCSLYTTTSTPCG